MSGTLPTAAFMWKTGWAAVAAALGATTVPALFQLDVTVYESMAIAAGTVVYNSLLLFARSRSVDEVA